MTSTVPHNVIEDDDEFDWEAAVREIDVACQATVPPTKNPTYPPNRTTLEENHIPTSSNTHKKLTTSRQSTLDKFVEKAGPSVQSENWNVRERGEDKIDDVEGFSYVKIDPQAAKTWIYPVNVPLRDYQLSIAKTALFSNTLVALPTGLGKTLIAAVVMYNYFRWFPEGKIVFAAPSRPLVMQQIEACHNIVGIPQEWTIDLTGQTSPKGRASFWKTKRVFFVTPQVLEKDIQSGTCVVKYLVCLVIDEAHRALGNYSYSVAVRELMAVPVQFRILALTATPGSKQQTVQHIIDNLQISTLEYRNESDPDVRPYVHDRKIELIEVAMGQDAVEINNVLFEVIRPFATRLSMAGLLQKRDFQTLSPCDLLNAREKFRQAPPQDLPSMNHRDVEGCFGVLITLYHIRKLLSSHGIRPAHEMLEEKLQPGHFAGQVSRNEAMLKAKFLMQQSLSNGVPNPKLSKVLEVLKNHFKANDPQISRVIIFSNFRGSVRDITNALMNVGDFIKATEFIGQSTGKALKGQSQKVQQAVLEKFRAGGYNIIVATSIGEEGLDIMEVDLVICFDANISPLRMIQRMGRTGRKHDGRVVVLAFEGSELKGYMRKQANSKAINKHMRSGGMSSFNFHSSPRMIPHIFKPEIQLIELSIEQFIPRRKKVKDDQHIHSPLFNANLTDAESDLLAKYFHPTNESTWRSSLIAFPHFQAFPSTMHKVMHSFRTEMLIDAMQRFQDLSFPRDGNASFAEDEAMSSLDSGVGTVSYSKKDLQSSHNSPENHLPRKVPDSNPSPTVNKETDSQGKDPPTHSYLFGSDVLSVDSLGRVVVLSVPILPLKEVLHSKCTHVRNNILLKCFKQDSCHSLGDYIEGSVQVENFSDRTASSEKRCKENKNTRILKPCKCDAEEENIHSGAEKKFQTLVQKMNFPNESDSTAKTPHVNETDVQLADDSSNDLRDVELSPRLTNFIRSGVVPESPIGYTGTLNGKGRGELTATDFGAPTMYRDEISLNWSISEQDEKGSKHSSAPGSDAPASSANEKIRTPVVNAPSSATRGSISGIQITEEVQTPLPDPTYISCSKDWCLSSGGNSESAQKKKKFKRLRKYGDQGKLRPPEGRRGIFSSRTKPTSATARPSSILLKNGRGKWKPMKEVIDFIEEEAEVSSEFEVSCDEDDEQEKSSDDDSFIDDRINPTSESTQEEAGGSNMMAIYRRSLISPSPMERLPKCFTDLSPESFTPETVIAESGSSSAMVNHILRTTQTGTESAGRISTSFHLKSETISSEAMQCTTNGIPKESENKMGSLKRKLSFFQVRTVPAIDPQQEFSFHYEATGRETSLQDQVQRVELKGEMLDDDLFYEGLDLDAVEDQAAKTLGYKSESSIPSKTKTVDPTPPQFRVLGSPSFDLGI